MSLTSNVLHPNGINPLSALKLYESVCLPSALYGCELWGKLSPSEMDKLEIAHRYCIKNMQCFPKRTRTDKALVMVGASSIECYIEERKLKFLGRLCTLSNNVVAKSAFVFLLYRYQNSL